jgi:hypothetical protein
MFCWFGIALHFITSLCQKGLFYASFGSVIVTGHCTGLKALIEEWWILRKAKI